MDEHNVHNPELKHYLMQKLWKKPFTKIIFISKKLFSFFMHLPYLTWYFTWYEYVLNCPLTVQHPPCVFSCSVVDSLLLNRDCGLLAFWTGKHVRATLWLKAQVMFPKASSNQSVSWFIQHMLTVVDAQSMLKMWSYH